jgi:hypothetical protein
MEKKTAEDNSWIERLKLYTIDFNKEQFKQLSRHICWVKCEGLIKECQEIEKLIDEQTEKSGTIDSIT